MFTFWSVTRKKSLLFWLLGFGLKTYGVWIWILYLTWTWAKGPVWNLTTFPKKTLLRQSPRYEYMWEGTSSRVRKNGYVPLGTYQDNNLENFGGGPVQYCKKNSYSNFLGRTSQKNHPAYNLISFCLASTIFTLNLCIAYKLQSLSLTPKCQYWAK